MLKQLPAGANILVVDDTIENLRLLSMILTERGHEVRPVSSGRLALEAAASYPPDAILLDVSMPEMNGLEVCTRLKQMDALRDIPVIFLTALADTADKVKGFAVGGADYITKPFQVEEVIARVDVHVALHRSRMEVQSSYDRLRTMEQLRDDLVHMIVHDIRSPLGALIMLLDFVKESAADRLSSSTAECLDTAIVAADKVNRMTNDLLDVSRLEAGKLPIDLTSTDVVCICNNVIDLLRPMERTRRLELVAAQSIEFRCDRNLIQRVVENLVGNAIKHTPSTGKIEISVSQSCSILRVEVRDDGRGVPMEVREKVFDRYATFNAGSGNKYHSAGLGLAFCRLVVEAHGGRIGVEAAAPQGSIFWFELPGQTQS